jgi:hypothetical protein
MSRPGPAPTQEDCDRFARWLLERVVQAGRGDHLREFGHRPHGRFWIGRLAPQSKSVQAGANETEDRLDPCAIGIRIRPTALDGRQILCRIEAYGWRKHNDGGHVKVGPVRVEVQVSTPARQGSEPLSTGGDQIAQAFREAGLDGLRAEIQCEIESVAGDPHLVVTLVNTSPGDLYESAGIEPVLFQVQMECDVGPTQDFVLEQIPESFRYLQRVPAYGVNCGVEKTGQGRFRTVDFVTWRQPRPLFWDHGRAGPQPDLRFSTLADDPLPHLQLLVDALVAWTHKEWSDSTLQEFARRDGWTDEMLGRASEEARRADDECRRIQRGLELLRTDERLRRAFQLMNRAFELAREIGTIVHDGWRAFQVGFLLYNLPLLAEVDGRRTVSTLWFPTGAGKTEAYIGLVLLAAFWDRLRGKHFGVTAWARFPLRALSFQQTQRMADLLATAELVRRDEKLRGDEFRLGCFMGEPSSPNRIEPDPETKKPRVRPEEHRSLLRCPFCRSEDLRVEFDESSWTLVHRCANRGCPWTGRPLPIHIVDDEIYRFLPTVVVGTVDKAALVAFQAALRGLYASPLGQCPVAGHGFTYAPRSSRPNGCLHPRCKGSPRALPQDEALFPPTLRIQDEIHLLRDSLGAIDSHYERLVDHLQTESGGPTPAIVGSSATIAGYDRHVQCLYGRPGTVFPVPGPEPGRSFWAVFDEAQPTMRTYVALAPRGVTLEFANDRCVEALQRAVRAALLDPDSVARDARIDPSVMPELVSLYGTTVVYGCTLRDVEAATRSVRTQVQLDPSPSGHRLKLEVVTLTGRTPAEEVRVALERLQRPEPDLEDRIHVVTASSMLSHGVDLDRLNVMVAWGLPLSVAELVQATARIGRRHAGLVLVLLKAARERDARVFSTFNVFMANAHQLVDPVPITHRSRRVLELTLPGLFAGRLLGVHEPRALRSRMGNLTSVGRARRYVLAVGRDPFVDEEYRAILRILGIGGSVLDRPMMDDASSFVGETVRKILDPSTRSMNVFDLLSPGPMRSLRDVERTVRVHCDED